MCLIQLPINKVFLCLIKIDQTYFVPKTATGDLVAINRAVLNASTKYNCESLSLLNYAYIVCYLRH